MKPWVGVGAVAALAVIAFALLWGAGELRYRNCLQSVELRYPVAYQPGLDDEFGSALREKPQAHFAFYEKAERDRALSGCSRWP